MAGSIVKWWKHKILGGYKQFSVQECTTDSEELMYHHQVRASSSCSAPPDLLLVNDRENNIPLRSKINDVAGGATTPSSDAAHASPDLAASNNNQNLHYQLQHHQQQQSKHQHQHQQVHTTHVTPHINTAKDSNGRHQKVPGVKQVQVQHEHSFENEGHAETHQSNSSTRHTHHHHQQRPEDHIRLEEFTCDVSVEGGKSSQPLQFSFTFYDLDGHHGKITKDDIVGIVYTIYESIGKSVVVPHSGSKTINVRLTVSPEGKSKANKAKKQQNVTSQKDGVPTFARRMHRYRPRKLIKSDEEDDDTNSEKEREGSIATKNVCTPVLNRSSKSVRTAKTKVDQSCCQLTQQPADANNQDSFYDHLKKGALADSCRECLAAAEENHSGFMSPTHNASGTTPHFATKMPSNEAYLKHIASTRIKMLRKSRKQKKYQDGMETRQRSLSVGSEACWSKSHILKQSQQQAQWNPEQYLNTTDMLDGVEMRMRKPIPSESLPTAQTRNSDECWKSALNRNDLISIIRESMEKNRLCFQLNGKPQANVSPIRQSSDHPHIMQDKHAQRHVSQQQQQRQRSNTVSKIPMLIANHSYRSQCYSNNNDLSPSEHRGNSNNIYQLQPHTSMYDQHTSVNAMTAASPNVMQRAKSNAGTRSSDGHHSKINLCGYDSFLHATICGGGLSHSPPSNNPMQSKQGEKSNSLNGIHQQIATVQPIMSCLTSNPPRASKTKGLSMTSNQIRTSKILRSGSYSQTHQPAFMSMQNSPHHHGYQRLCSNVRQNLSALNLEKSHYALTEKGQREQAKNYDQLLYAKLAEKLQQTNLASINKDNMQRRRHRVLRHKRSSSTVAEANKASTPATTFSKTSDYSPFIPICADPGECENLIVPTSEDECHSHHDVNTTNDIQAEAAVSRHVAEGTLVELDDSNRDEKYTTTNHSNTNLILDLESDNIDVHMDDELAAEEEEELEEHLGDRETIGLNKSGRSSSVSKGDNEDIIANASGANTSATSSLIHRYVHEHIHHHYHHFEDKDD